MKAQQQKSTLFPYTTLFRSLAEVLGCSLNDRGSFVVSERDISRERYETSPVVRSEEHTSELQSRGHLVCRLLLEKKKKIQSIFSLIRNNTIDILTFMT